MEGIFIYLDLMKLLFREFIYQVFILPLNFLLCLGDEVGHLHFLDLLLKNNY